MVERHPFDPAMVLKMELIAYLYNLTERQVEVYINEYLPAKYFMGLAADQSALDHSTLTVFRERLVKRGRLKIFEEMLDEIVQIPLRSGIRFGAMQIVDSVPSIANINTDKDQNPQGKGKRPRDPDARWGVKHTRKMENEEGKEEKHTEYFYGFKAHVSLNAENGLVTSMEVTSGEALNAHHFTALVNHDLKQSLPVDTCTADKAYDADENQCHLELHGLHYAIRLHRTRLGKKDDAKQVWLDLSQTPQYQQDLKEQYKDERKFGEAKQEHGFARCRYLGRAGFTALDFFIAIVLNL